ncbi:MAG: FAD-dependent oxidoreductase [bacterium]
MKVTVVGAGVFGATGAIALAARGHAVRLVDPGPLPRPEAASTDHSKVVRAAYGDDIVYVQMAADAITRWHDWNARWGEVLYHEDGFLLRTRGPMPPDGFEARSYATLAARGWPVERLDAAALAARFPGWRAEAYPDGFLDRRAGWTAASAVMNRLYADARAAGVELCEGLAVDALVERAGRVVGVRAGGDVIEADVTVVAAGAWTPTLVPALAEVMRATGHPILMFRAPDAIDWRPPRFVPWAADIAATGWYGFAATPDGLVKVARHAAGVPLDPRGPRIVPPGVVDEARAFLRATFPALADAPLESTRLCAYCDTFDGHFWIDRDPTRAGLVVACGGSGHAFKFAPVLGDRIAAAVEGRRDGVEARFHWRARGAGGSEGARAGG